MLKTKFLAVAVREALRFLVENLTKVWIKLYNVRTILNNSLPLITCESKAQ